jgi:putative FmdB family regulatory protein
MPLYEYRCQECSVRFERIERASALHDGRCPECGGVAHRLIGAPALQFKGSGWYVTDYGKANGSAPRPTAAETEKAKATVESPTESKPKTTTKKKTNAKVA